ncbi:MAG: hypothetical protein ACREFE_18400, partial [Limisphaerales bacterium]
VYEPFFPRRSESHYMFIGRLAAAGVLIAAGFICLAYDTFLELLKFFWEYNVIVAAAFWCGLKWRRATRAGAWASMLVAFTLYLLLPVGLPAIFPGLRTIEKCLATTRERIVTQHYIATKWDVEERRRGIENWNMEQASNLFPSSKPPEPLFIGESVTRDFSIAPRAIYWAEGIGEINGVKRGEGMFYPGMFLLGQFFNLTANSHALNETIRYACKILLPFLILIAVSLLTRPDDSEKIRRFFLRMRTKVRRARDEDERTVQAAYANPESTRATLLFPKSQFEFFKWDREDAIGFFGGCLLAFAVIGLLYLILHL